MPRVIIQAGGLGQRLLPYTTVLPKPLMPVAERPIVEIVIRQLVGQGFSDITITLGHLGDLIRAVIGDGSHLGASVDYVHEREPLGTVGPLQMIEGLTEPFLVMNGDLLTDFSFRDFMDSHLAHNADLTVGTYLKSVSISLGVIDADADGRVVGFREKPKFTYPCSMGIYAFRPEVLELVPRGKYFGFDDLMRTCLDEGVHVRTHQHEGLWLDIGRYEDYERASEMFLANRDRLLGSPAMASAPGTQA